jgi:hypothetical protein
MDDPGFYTIGHPEYYETLSRIPIQPAYVDALRAAVPADWAVVRSDIWLHAGSRTSPLTEQGFKIHLSCALPDALDMIQRFVPLCTGRNVQFKIAADPVLHGFLNSKRYSRGGAGKFATIYPADHACFLELIDALHQATKGMQGPYILSDKRYPGSKVVFYRWGGFQRIRNLRPDGIQRMMVRTPDNELTFDDRLPFFRLPEWVTDPFPEEVTESEGDSELLHDRYKVQKALAFTNTGGVYLARDQRTGLAVVVKEARPHTLIWGAKRVALDATAALRNECAVLERLQGLPCVPQFIEFYQEWEHTFLVQTYFDGMPLANYRALEDVIVMTKMDDRDAIIRFCAIWRQICLRLLDAVDAIHGRGVIIGDISPGNVLIDRTTGELVLIDFEGAIVSGAAEEITRMGANWFNPGFRKVESRQAGSLSQVDDAYSCGMLLYNVVCPIQSLFELDKKQPIFRILDHFVEAGLPVEIRVIIQELLAGDQEGARRHAESWVLPEAQFAELPSDAQAPDRDATERHAIQA